MFLFMTLNVLTETSLEHLKGIKRTAHDPEVVGLNPSGVEFRMCILSCQICTKKPSHMTWFYRSLCYRSQDIAYAHVDTLPVMFIFSQVRED